MQTQLDFLYRFCAIICLLVFPVSGWTQTSEESGVQVDLRATHFEKEIRPALIEHCLECHSAETEASGGLLLDSLVGWQAGGDSGLAIVPGNPGESRLLRALSYTDPNLQMPPEGKLSPQILAAFERWIIEGAFDPRSSSRPLPMRQTGLLVEQAQEHWAYRPMATVATPLGSSVGAERISQASTGSPIDAFIESKLSEHKLVPAPAASREVVIRRLTYDLVGLPPSLEQLAFADATDQSDAIVYQKLVDQLLESPQFGEHFARKWMDVARYAESITLRGFVLPQAWRYRDYLIQAFAEDRPFDQMIREQIAGDLMDHDQLRERQMQCIATGFLVLGNTNLETQDKIQLEMDFIDEQLEVIGRAFLGQTIGCARCHDHKFDPIPTRDYYALAGIFRSAIAMEHENLSKWIEQPLPLSEDEQAHYEHLEERLADLNQQLAALKKNTNTTAAADKRRISIEELMGVVVDSRHAKLVGMWTESSSQGRIIGDSYLHDANTGKGQKTATFEPMHLTPGEYKIRFAYTAGSNRASNALVRVFSADGEATIRVNQRKAPDEEGSWISLGVFRFEKDGQAFVLISNDETDGHVIADAVQFLPQDKKALADETVKVANKENDRPEKESEVEAEVTARLEGKLQKLETQVKKIQTELSARPRYLTIMEQSSPLDIPIHIRGDVHNLGDIVPRGFLTAFNSTHAPTISAESSGRLEFAHWVSSSNNPLTARVYANRVWSWIMGQGLVASVSNFGTTGTPPSHPELLDWLADELVHSGWSTKHLVRLIVGSNAYRRSLVEPSEEHKQIDPSNLFYWRANSRRLPVEAIRDAMLTISGELDSTLGGSLIRPNTRSDYDYPHSSTRRSIYHPVFRNSLPELFEAFDFADSSMSIGQRPRSTVATQALVLLNHPWVAARAKAAAVRLQAVYGQSNLKELVNGLFIECYGRYPTPTETLVCLQYLEAAGASNTSDRFEQLVHSSLAAIDFRFLE